MLFVKYIFLLEQIYQLFIMFYFPWFWPNSYVSTQIIYNWIYNTKRKTEQVCFIMNSHSTAIEWRLQIHSKPSSTSNLLESAV